MKRFLVFGMTENPGGVENFLMNYYRHLDRDKIQFDFLCNTLNTVAYEKELQELGGHVFHIPARRDGFVHFYREMEKVYKEHSKQWDGVWVNVSSLANIDYLKAALKFHIPKRIIHSHNAENMDGILRGMLHQWNVGQVGRFATDFWACSEDAGRWFYGKNRKSVIIHNAIDIERVCFNESKRRTLRQRHSLDDHYVIGHVGRLHFQKNQEFVIDIFQQFHKMHKDSRLVLIGQGEDEKKLQEKTAALGLTDAVFFAGVQNDIQGWLSAFDLFLFPSRFEGVSIAALEAQANGLPVIASQGVITEETKIIDTFQFFDLKNSAQDWALMIEKCCQKKRLDDDQIRRVFSKKGYDIKIEVKKLERLLTDFNE